MLKIKTMFTTWTTIRHGQPANSCNFGFERFRRRRSVVNQPRTYTTPRRPLLLQMGALIGITAMLSTAMPSLAQSWLQRSVRFIVPLGPGSGTDVTARLFADRLAVRWGKPVVVENRPGGDGIVAISAFVGAHDDH